MQSQPFPRHPPSPADHKKPTSPRAPPARGWECGSNCTWQGSNSESKTVVWLVSHPGPAALLFSFACLNPFQPHTLLPAGATAPSPAWRGEGSWGGVPSHSPAPKNGRMGDSQAGEPAGTGCTEPAVGHRDIPRPPRMAGGPGTSHPLIPELMSLPQRASQMALGSLRGHGHTCWGPCATPGWSDTPPRAVPAWWHWVI